MQSMQYHLVVNGILCYSFAILCPNITYTGVCGSPPDSLPGSPSNMPNYNLHSARASDFQCLLSMRRVKQHCSLKDNPAHQS